MKITIRPVADPRKEIDLTDCLVSAIAGELWKRYGGNDQLNWLEAERYLERLVSSPPRVQAARFSTLGEEPGAAKNLNYARHADASGSRSTKYPLVLPNRTRSGGQERSLSDAV